MSEKLQRRLVRNSFLALFLVLAIILTGMALVSYQRLVGNSDAMLDGLWANRNLFQYVEKNETPVNTEKAFSYALFFAAIADSKTGELLQIAPTNLSEEFLASAEQITKTAVLSNLSRSFAGTYRYLKGTEPDGTVEIIFLDCETKLDEFTKFVLFGIVLAVIGLVAAVTLILSSYHRVLSAINESNQKYRRYLLDSGHEFNTPIAIILADVDVLEMELENNEWVGDIRKQAKRLDSLTSDLGLLAQMENACITPEMIDFPVSDVILEAASSFLMTASRHKISLDLQIQPMLSMRGNEKNISQLIAILLDNALKYAPEETEIRLMLEQVGTSIHLTVSNQTNFHIPKESLALLFDRFYRIRSPEDSPPKGSGIGLSIAKAIVNTHNGRIVALSPEEKVFKIDITFPL